MVTEFYVDSCGVSEQMVSSSGLAKPADWFVDWVNQQRGGSESGVKVNETTILTHGPVWQAVNVLAGDLGLIPFNVRRRTGKDTYEPAEDDPVNLVLTKKTNAFQTPAIWKEWAWGTAFIWGNSLSRITRTNNGRISGLVPLPPQWCGYDVDEDGVPFYYVMHPKLGTLTYDMEEIVHLRGLTSDGFWGYRLAEVVAGVVGHGLALRKHGNATFKNSSRPSGVLQHPGKLSREAREEMRKDWDAIHSGADNAGRMAILWEGMTLNPYSISNHDAQWLEAMRLDREQCAGIFNLPPHKLGALENAAVRSNLEEQNREYYNTSLARHVNKTREELNDKLMTRPDMDVRPDPTEILRGDLLTQVETAERAITATIWSPNEARVWMGMNPREGGDEYTNPNTTAGGEKPAGDEREMKQAARAMVDRQARQLCMAEHNRLVNKSKGRKELASYLDQFYPTDFQELAKEVLYPAYHVASMCCRVARFDEIIALYAAQSKARAMIFAKSSLEPKARSQKLETEWPVEPRVQALLMSIFGE